jgi:MoxR-like ATPase
LEYIIAAQIAGGHVMLADAHGVGKTSLARALAGSIRWVEDESSKDSHGIKHFNRIQCTVDLLPQDILVPPRLKGPSSRPWRSRPLQWKARPTSCRIPFS